MKATLCFVATNRINLETKITVQGFEPWTINIRYNHFNNITTLDNISEVIVYSIVTETIFSLLQYRNGVNDSNIESNVG